MRENEINPTYPELFGKKKWVYGLLIALMLLLGLFIRIYDIDDLPLDFHPTRQLFTAIVARARYYQTLPEGSLSQDRYQSSQTQLNAEVTDAPVYDGLVVLFYRLFGREDLVIPRVVSIIFWLLGGGGLFLLAKDMSSRDGGMIALAVYLFLPFGVVVSRTIQPDPLMTCLIIYTWWSMYRWIQKQTWSWAILVGLLGGLAVLTKALAAFSILGGFIAILVIRGLKKNLRSMQFWTMGLIAALPTLIYMFIGFFVKGDLGGQFRLRFFPQDWIDPVFYLQWERMLEKVVGLLPFILGIVGVFFFEKKHDRRFMIWLWSGYFLFGIVFSYFFATHDYYHITAVPLIAMSVSAYAVILADRYMKVKHTPVMRIALIIVIVIAIGANLWDVRDVLHKADYRGQDAVYARIGQVAGSGRSIIALTQDYGYRLQYWGWINPAQIWLYTGDMALRGIGEMDQAAFDELFTQAIEGKDLFIVTDLVELEKQPLLKQALNDYPIFDIGESYVIYDLYALPGGSG